MQRELLYGNNTQEKVKLTSDTILNSKHYAQVALFWNNINVTPDLKHSTQRRVNNVHLYVKNYLNEPSIYNVNTTFISCGIRTYLHGDTKTGLGNSPGERQEEI